MLESGGGTLYWCSGDYAGFVYKELRDPTALAHLAHLIATFGEHDTMGMASPKAMVFNTNSEPTGYIMRDIKGVPLAQAAEYHLRAISLLGVLHNVVQVMAYALDRSFFPMNEHGGKVLIMGSGASTSAIVVDVDAWVPLHVWHSLGVSTDSVEKAALEQLGTMFMCCDVNETYSTIFDVVDCKLQVNHGSIQEFVASLALLQGLHKQECDTLPPRIIFDTLPRHPTSDMGHACGIIEEG